MLESFLSQVHEGWAVLSTRSGENETSDTVPMWSTSANCGVGYARLATDIDGRRRLLIPVTETAIVPVESSGAGLAIQELRLQIDGSWARFIDISCNDTQLFAAFSTIISEVLQRISDGAPPPAAIVGALEDYRELLRRSSQRLSREFLTGLAGELLLLRDIIRIDPAAIAAWTGPSGGRHDYIGPGISIEVKSSLRTTGRQVTISSIDQLDYPAGEDLYLWWFRFEESGSGGTSIREIVRSIWNELLDKSAFSDRLKALRIDDWQHDESIANFRIRLLADDVYRVTEEFPRLSREAFPGKRLPKGVMDCKYTIDLTQADDLRLSADEAQRVKERLAS
ncbi:MAG: PD-(D/E)XK motif protein [Cyanobacteria bacterium J06555_12]